MVLELVLKLSTRFKYFPGRADRLSLMQVERGGLARNIPSKRGKPLFIKRFQDAH